jgi:hypothetical protein
MLIPSIEIIITDVVTGKNLVITRVNHVEVESSWKTLTDTAKIMMPRNIRILNGDINTIIKRGSTVSIRAGYNGVMNQEFVGYVSRLDTKIPFTIFCEDQMWQLKQTSFTGSFKNVALKDLITFIYPGQAKVIDLKLPAYRIDRATAAKVLSSIKEQYGLISYFQDQVLNVGFAYDLSAKTEVIYHFQRNVPADGNELVYKVPEDYKVRVKGISMLPGGKTLEFTATDAGGEEYNTSNGKAKGKFDGDEIVLRWYNQTEEQLERLVNDQIKKYKIGGYQGTLKAFGAPYSRHGDIAHLVNRLYPETEGKYFIDKTTMHYDNDGYRRTIEIGRKVAA